jgi:hypothetical protein
MESASLFENLRATNSLQQYAGCSATGGPQKNRELLVGYPGITGTLESERLALIRPGQWYAGLRQLRCA